MSELKKHLDRLEENLSIRHVKEILWTGIGRNIQQPVHGLAGIIERLEQTRLEEEFERFSSHIKIIDWSKI